MHNKIPILMYHQVISVAHPNFYTHTVTTKAFATQIRTLKLLGFNTITVSELIGFTEGNNNLPTNPIMISFDDGFEDAIENAVPILHDSGFKTAMMLPSVHDPIIIIVNHIKARDSNFQNKLYDLVLDYSFWLGVWSAAKKDTNGKLLISKIQSTSKN